LMFVIALAITFPSILGSASQEFYLIGDGVRSKGKKVFPQGYFVEPTDSSLKIAGNFGEIRPNHFHAGLDVKTAGREGAYIYAAAEGYVSRIKISPYGYGKCLYITHPNGFVTVYAHLQRLSGKIAEYVEREQYKAEKFDVELFPTADILQVKQCDTIAISGNTGGSQSPHLHFEVRDAITEVAYNPFLFGYKVEDTVSPRLVTLAVYPANDTSFVNGKNSSKKMTLNGSKGRYKLSSAEKITVSGDIGFGIEAYDYSNIAAAGKLGAYSIDLYIDGQRIYYHELNEITFSESRYINSHIDYAEEAKSNREIQKCFRDPNNMLSIYQCVINEGLFRFEDTLSHPVKFVVKDFFGNISKLEFKVKGTSTASLLPKIPRSEVKNFKCTDPNKLETESVLINIDPCTLYENIDFDYSVSKDTLSGTFAPVHSVHKTDVPLHAAYSLSIKAKAIPVHLQSKATIVLLDGKNIMTDQKGEYRDGLKGAGWVTTQTKYFGRFTVALDTAPPSIKPYNISSNKNMSSSKTLAVKIGDNLSGIKSYRATVDGKWILMEYEPKKALLFYEFDERVARGKHTFHIEVTDGKDNVRTYKADFVR